jgi:cell division control protein 6
MPAPTKRTRSTPNADPEGSGTPPATASNAPSTPVTRRTLSTRPPPARSATANQTTTPPSILTRSNSMFAPSTRRTTNANTQAAAGNAGSTVYAGMGFPATPTTPSTSVLAGTTRGGMLLRTQSTSSIPSPTQLKAGMAPAPGAGRGKGDPEGGAGGKRWGKGKENVPPKEDEEEGSQDGARKRLRTSTRSGSFSTAGRGRSGSVMSVRSESGGECRVFTTVYPTYVYRPPSIPGSLIVLVRLCVVHLAPPLALSITLIRHVALVRVHCYVDRPARSIEQGDGRRQDSYQAQSRHT